MVLLVGDFKQKRPPLQAEHNLETHLAAMDSNVVASCRYGIWFAKLLLPAQEWIPMHRIASGIIPYDAENMQVMWEGDYRGVCLEIANKLFAPSWFSRKPAIWQAQSLF